jgi:hypothetical protein
LQFTAAREDLGTDVDSANVHIDDKLVAESELAILKEGLKSAQEVLKA